MRVTNIGHATVLIEMDRIRLLTDPVFGARILHLRRRFSGEQLAPKGEITAILISHTHWDHFNLPTLERFGKDCLVIIPHGEGHKLGKRGFQNVQELSSGETIQVGPLTIQATHAEHGQRRFGLIRKIDCLGFLIQGSNTVYFAGDTALFPGMAEIGENLDVALLPVWGWGPTLGHGYMDPYQAAKAVQLLKPRVAIPIHWGTYYPMGFIPSRTRFLSDPPQQFAEYVAEMAHAAKVQILSPGEKYELITIGEGA